MADALFDPQCRRCPRLATFCESTGERFPGYHAAPVPAFGDAAPRWLIVGLAPGLHGANRTGRIFTGDRSGDFLYQAYKAMDLKLLRQVSLRNLLIYLRSNTQQPMNLVFPQRVKFLEMHNAHVVQGKNISVATVLLNFLK